jgi:putative sigma-54 modulation protein
MAIPVHIFAKDMAVTDRLKQYVEKKLGKLDHHLDFLEEIRVEIKYNATVRQAEDRHVTQVTAKGKNITLRVEERNEDVLASVDMALDKMERRIEKFKGKQTLKHKGEAPRQKVPADLHYEEESREGFNNAITRRKKMVLEPMSEADAIDQMQMLGHEEFFLFQNISTGKINLIYRRRDGYFGIIETDLR